MVISIEINNRVYQIDARNPLDISIPLDFNGAQPNAFDVPAAVSEPCETGDFIGDTRRGGSCNFETYNFIPHCNGTHTECVGHITNERIFVRDCLKDSFIPATLASVTPENAARTSETYAVKLNVEDNLITEKVLRSALKNGDADWLSALIIRTLPNDDGKKTRRYMEKSPPFFSTEAMRFIVERGVKHLLVDLPSIDRTFDEGKLSNHRIFWNVAAESRQIKETSAVDHTISELIYVPDKISDGAYFLNLQIAAFNADAAPSRPLLFKVFERRNRDAV